MRQGRVAWDKPLSLVVGFQQKPAEKAEVNEIREQECGRMEVRERNGG